MTETAGVETTPDDAARTEAVRRNPFWATRGPGIVNESRLRAEFVAGVDWGRADERARIAARRDEVAEALHADACADDDCEGADMTDYDRQTDIALAAALGVKTDG